VKNQFDSKACFTLTIPLLVAVLFRCCIFKNLRNLAYFCYLGGMRTRLFLSEAAKKLLAKKGEKTKKAATASSGTGSNKPDKGGK